MFRSAKLGGFLQRGRQGKRRRQTSVPYPSRRNLSEVFVAGEPTSFVIMHASLMSCYHRIVGFLFGFSLASSFAAYHLLEEYQQASATLQASVETLQNSTEKVGIYQNQLN